MSKKKRYDEEKSELFWSCVIVNHVWSELNLNINAHGLSSSFNVNREKNKSKYMTVNLIHEEKLSQEKKSVFLENRGSFIDFFSCEKLWKNFLRPWLTQLFCYYLKFFFYFLFLLTRCPAGKWKENLLDCLWDKFFLFFMRSKYLQDINVIWCSWILAHKYWY